MSSSTTRLFRHGVPALGAFFVSSTNWQTTSCDAPSTDDEHRRPKPYGMIPDAKGDFHRLFPKRQLWQPKLEYPLWDNNWDNLHPKPSGDEHEDHKRMRHIRHEGVTRHIILIRHGQYDEREKDDSKRLLTNLGKQQADLTGRRLREMMEGANKEFGPCKIKVLRVSNLARAIETADIIAAHLPGVEYAKPDPDLNEGRPCHNIPGGRASESTIQKTEEQHARIEAAFQKIFHRAPPPPLLMSDEGSDGSKSSDHNVPASDCKHEFEIIVCHANVIRYFFCRALQMPPEAWLRLCTFNCSLTYFTIRPTGTVSCRMLGDIGHLPYGMTTFSMHTGYNW